MLDNFSKECSKNVQSEILLSKTATRQKLIADMMEEAENYGLTALTWIREPEA